MPRGALIFCDMNSVVVASCVLFGLALLPAPAIRGVLATTAGSLFEATPFILAGMALSALAARAPCGPAAIRLAMAHLGCGCADGPSARSLPAAAAMAMTFGSFAALARLSAATALARFLPRRCKHHAPPESLLAQLSSVLPAATIGAVALHALTGVRVEAAAPAVQWLGGALFGVLAAPCALGTVAIAASLHVRAPLAAVGLLCTSGIADIRTFARSHAHHPQHDGSAYALAALALGLVAARGGDALVHPRFAFPLACCAIACAILAIVHRRARSHEATSLATPAIMLAGAILVAPPPVYTATQTTLTSLFPGERVSFTGTLVRSSGADALVRFAITCCRADATPVVVQLARRGRFKPGTWLHADGTIERAKGKRLALYARVLVPVPAPGDPFIYR